MQIFLLPASSQPVDALHRDPPSTFIATANPIGFASHTDIDGTNFHREASDQLS